MVQNETLTAKVAFSVRGALRDMFDEEHWEKAYKEHDNTFKLKFEVRVYTGGVRTHTLGQQINSYRKAAIFWTRNPKLVNPMKDKRIWVQISKNFEPYIALTVDDVRRELFDFEEKIAIEPTELGAGTHDVKADISVSWQKHVYSEPESHKASVSTSVTIN